MSVQILFRRGTAADWTSANPILGNGEPGFETDTGRLKIGDNVTAWNALSYIQGTGGVADGNTTYTVSAETATGGVDIRLTGSDASTDAVKIAAGSNVTVTRTDANTITIASTDTTGATTLDGLTDVVLTSPAVGEVLKYNGTSWVNDTDLNTGSGAVALNDITDVVVTTPTTGQVLKYNGTAWVNDTDSTGGGGVLPTRADLVGSSGSLANGASGPINITGYKAYSLLKVATSAAAWVRLYVSEAARSADSSRLQGTDPAPGSGVIAEVITTGAETVLISPGAVGFNDEGPVTTNIPVRVTNLSGSTGTITVTLTAIQLEA